MNDDAELSARGAAAYAAKDYVAAFSLYKQLADAGHVSCQIFLAWMLHNGLGVEADNQEALRWLTIAADSESTDAMYYCGRLHAALGDYKASVPWFIKSAERGYAPALYRLGLAYLRGLGVHVDRNVAAGHLEAAAERGHIFACRELALDRVRNGKNIYERLSGGILFMKAVYLGLRIARSNPYAAELKR